MEFNGSRTSTDYNIVMSIIVFVCLLGFLGSIFPLVELIISVFFIIAILAALSLWVRSILRNRRLDNEAMYGPLETKVFHHD